VDESGKGFEGKGMGVGREGGIADTGEQGQDSPAAARAFSFLIPFRALSIGFLRVAP
jgi:hypothetical protein